MNPSQPQSKYCQFADLNNGVWLFTFSEASNPAVDEWYEWQSYLKETVPNANNKRVCMLLDMRKSGTIPLLYTLQKARDWRKQYADIRTYHVQVALWLKPFPSYQQPYIKLIKDGINLFTLQQVKAEMFFEDQQEAVDWLLQSAEPLERLG